MQIILYTVPLLTLVLLTICVAVVAEPIVVGYYPSWKRAKMEGIDFKKYTHVNIAFGIPRNDGSFTFEDEWALPQILQQIRSNGNDNAKALLSVGGWTGSNLFSDILKNNDSRTRLLNSMADYVKDHGLDGIDIDWEYPGRLGNACNVFDAQNDTPNFLTFLHDLRDKFDSQFGERKKLITLAVRVQPFDTPSGPSSDVSEFAKYVDFTNVMAYDIGGPWNSETGANAPFNYEQGKGTPLSFVSSIDAWTNAGWPANQLVAGLGFYGRSSVALQNMIKDASNQYQSQSHDVPLGDSEDAPWYDTCAKTTSNSGTWQWRNLRSQGVLVNKNTAAAPWVRQWDPVTQTPWLFNPETKRFLSYDDPDSIKIKSDYAASRGLAGVMIWSANMDFNSELVDAARSFGRESSDGNSSTSGSSLPASTSSSPESTSSKPKNTKTKTSANTQTTTSTSSGITSSTTSTTSGQAEETPSDNGLLPGKPCSDYGEYRCVDPNGRNMAYLVCIGTWQQVSCAQGTVCLSLNKSIICGWPTFKHLIFGIDSALNIF
ncbi:glycoside hydrolase superfamily [Kickxella alabastrina]|uniref:glycoside hydrolase superfamily n=1 Tax=Kickxella alabastrina TaxID=61397 RepID=UPI002220D078|nr:glycoside hydrolase superfamily [Kickxella alabastrina]KAI7823437.1 glycoside hydrolase superfamily [Kickxella alabastrina]